ncbi:hypothetical protein [Saccharopolyspora tripterygii]
MVLMMTGIGLVLGIGIGFLVGFLVFRNKQQSPGYPQQAQFAQPQQWQAAPQQWQQTPPQFPPQHGYGQQPRPPQ